MNLVTDFASRHPRQMAGFSEAWWPAVQALLSADRDPIPPAPLREGYYAGQNDDYWVSGAIDAVKAATSYTGGEPSLPAESAVLDFGCSSGRVLRHLARLVMAGGQAWGTDVNAEALGWMRDHLTAPMALFPSSHTPLLPFSDETLDLVTAFSVLTHFDHNEEAWLLELRRVLKPGGLLYVTTLGTVWREIGPGHVLMQNLGGHDKFASQAQGGDMPEPRLAFGFDEANPYSYTVFRTREYIAEGWAPHFAAFEFREQYHDFQDVCLLRR